MGEILIVTGVGLTLFGGACMDSPDLFYPIAMCIFGALLIGLGLILGGNDNVERKNLRRHNERRREKRVRDFTQRTL